MPRETLFPWRLREQCWLIFQRSRYPKHTRVADRLFRPLAPEVGLGFRAPRPAILSGLAPQLDPPENKLPGLSCCRGPTKPRLGLALERLLSLDAATARGSRAEAREWLARLLRSAAYRVGDAPPPGFSSRVFKT